MFAFILGVQLALDGLDRLVDALEEHGVLSAVEAAGTCPMTCSDLGEMISNRSSDWAGRQAPSMKKAW